MNIIFSDDCFLLPREWSCNMQFYNNLKDYNISIDIQNIKIFHFSGWSKLCGDNPKLKDIPFVMEYRDFAKNVPLYNDRILRHIGVSK